MQRPQWQALRPRSEPGSSWLAGWLLLRCAPHGGAEQALLAAEREQASIFRRRLNAHPKAPERLRPCWRRPASRAPTPLLPCSAKGNIHSVRMPRISSSRKMYILHTDGMGICLQTSLHTIQP